MWPLGVRCAIFDISTPEWMPYLLIACMRTAHWAEATAPGSKGV